MCVCVKGRIFIKKDNWTTATLFFLLFKNYHKVSVWGQSLAWVRCIESHSAGKVLGILVDEILDMSQQSVLTAQKANCILGCTKTCGQDVKGGGFCPSTLSLWDPTWSAASSSGEVGLLSMEKRRVWEELIGPSSSLRGLIKRKGRHFLNRPIGKRHVAMVLNWKRGGLEQMLGRNVLVRDTALTEFKATLDGALGNLISEWHPWPCQGICIRWSLSFLPRQTIQWHLDALFSVGLTTVWGPLWTIYITFAFRPTQFY